MNQQLPTKQKKSLLFLSIGILLMLASCFLLLTSPARASEVSLGIYPPIIQVDATPPTAIKHPVKIKNNTDSPVTLSITLRPFQSKDMNGHVDFLDEKELQLRDKDIFQKIQILDEDTPVSEISLAPQEEKTLTLKIGLPKDEPPADYYFSIVFVSQNGDTASNGPAIAGGIASNVLLSIGPKGPAKGFIEKFVAPLYVTNGPIPFTVVLHNLTPYYIAPQGQILIRNLYGQLIGNVELLQSNILANSSRTIPDSSHISQDKAIWNEEFLFGPYKATLTVALSPQGPVYHRTIYFFALPLHYLLGFFITAVVLTIVITRIRRRLKTSL